MGKSMTGARACARGKVRSPRRQGARARTKAPPPGRQRRLGRGASGHAPDEPNGAERSRALPSAAEPSRVERPGVGWCSCVPAAQQSAAPASPPPPPPQRGLRRPAGHPPGGRLGAQGERPSYGGRRRRRCQVSARRGPSAPCAPATVSPRVCVCLCLSAPCVCASCFPPRLTPGPARSVHQPLPPAARVFLSAASTPMLGGSAPSPRDPAFRPSVITPAPSSRRGRPGGLWCHRSWGSA